MVATSARFDLGQTVATPGAVAALRQAGVPPQALLVRHARGDWGVVPPEDAALNETALVDGDRLLSAYRLHDGVEVWVVTERVGDDGRRAATTILLPSEY